MSSPTDDCVICGCPMVDHVPRLKYVLKAWFLHRILSGRMVVRGRG